MIERIEVVKGPRSALWGSDAIGGVVNIVTRRGSQDGLDHGSRVWRSYDTQARQRQRRLRPRRVRQALDVGRVVDGQRRAFRPARTDTIDRGYRQPEYANVALRADVGAAEVTVRLLAHVEGNRPSTPISSWRRSTRTTSRRPRPPKSEPAGRRPRATARFCGQRTSRTKSSRTSRRTSSRLTAIRSTRSTTGSRSGRARARVSAAMYYARAAPTANRTARASKSDTDAVNRLRAGPHHERPAQLRIARARVHRSRDGGVRIHVQRRVRLCVQRASVRACMHWQAAGFVPPTRRTATATAAIRTSKPEQLAQLRNRRASHALTDRQSARRSRLSTTDIEDLIDFTVLSYDPFEGINQNVAEARIEGIEASWVYTRRRCGRPAWKRSTRIHGTAPTIRGCCRRAAGEPHRRPDARIRSGGAARPRRARRRRSQGLRLSNRT